MGERKTCKACSIEKDIADFYWRKDNGKYRPECKDCVIKRAEKWDIENKDRRRETNKIYREENKESIKAKNKIWRDASGDYRKNYVANNPHIMNPIRKRIYEKNRDRYNLKKKEWYQNNKEKHAENRTKYELKNKDRLRAARRKWERNRLATDINYVLQKTLRSRIRVAVKLLGGNLNSERTEKLIGCNIEFFRKFIELQFKEGMNWDNWCLNGWHLDHKIPISWFNLENEHCMLLAFNYKNMQPLWAIDNIKKNNNYADKVVF